MKTLSKFLTIAMLFIGCIRQADAQINSPFGMHTAWTRPYLKAEDKPDFKSLDYSDALNIGVKWERPALYVSYPFNFELMDRIYKDIPQKIMIMANIETPRVNGTFKLRIMEKEYTNFVEQVIERYDGDGKNDMPGLKNPIRYWQIDNEPPFWQFGPVDNLSPDSLIQWMKNSWNDYAYILEIADSAIKSACPDCKTIIGGMVGESIDRIPVILKDFYEPILKQLNGKHIDVFDFHIFGSAKGEYKNSKVIYEMIHYDLNKYGYKNTEIWNIESGTFSGSLSIGNNIIKQSEKEQAVDLLKRVVFPLTLGVKKVFWAWAMVEGVNPIDDNDFFDNTGLIYDGIGNSDLGYGVKKLSWYTYKKMVEVLEGSDWNNINIIQESNNIYIYKFTKNGNPIYVAWNDSGISQTITISGITSNQVKTTAAVPMVASGSQVTDYTTAFNTDTVTVSNNTLTLTLDSLPVFIEPLITTLLENNTENGFNEILVYPNPSGNTINFQLPVSNSQLRVFDALGNIVFEKTLNSKHEVLNLNLPCGMYFYRVHNNEQVHYSGKLIIQ